MRQFGLIGYPIKHSFSPGYFKDKFKIEKIADARYDLYPLEQIELFEELKGLQGLNVTIPYKEAVIPFLDELSLEAKEIGAVNTIKFSDGRKVGFNTDSYGFKYSLQPLIEGKKVAHALVLGTGGAAKAVWYVLEKLKIPFYKVSRSSGDILYQDIDESLLKKNLLIVNTTPLGMAPNIQQCPDLPYKAIGPDHILYDLVYNPEKTLFLIKGAAQGATIKNGLEMLQLQADKAWQIWNT